MSTSAPLFLIILLPVLGACFLTVFLRIRVQRANASSLIAKGLASCCFLLLSFTGIPGAKNSYPLFVTIGLFFGLLGDIWLDLKYNCPEESDRYTFAGFYSFAAGHVFFLIALIRCFGEGASAGLHFVLPFALSAVCGIAIGMGGKLLKLDYGRFRNVTMFYGALLISSALISAGLILKTGGQRRPLILFFIGAVLFLLSDLVLSGTYFGKGKNRPADIISNPILYYAAQLLIAPSAVAGG